MVETIPLNMWNVSEVARKTGLSIAELDLMYMNASERNEVCVFTIETAIKRTNIPR